jgi:hypothetical protein
MIQRIKRKIKKLLHAISDRNDLASLHPSDRELIDSLQQSRLTYLSDHKLVNLLRTLSQLDQSQVAGCIIEAGCALGGSSILLAKKKSDQRCLKVYDVFGLIPPPTEEDTADVHERYQEIVSGHSTGLGGDKYYGYEDDLYSKVVGNFSDYGLVPRAGQIELIKGLVQDTMKIDGLVAMAHIDVDWYDPVMTCLKRIYPNLSIGGSIILDDYSSWGGCRKATDEFLRTVVGTFRLDYPARTLRITRIK